MIIGVPREAGVQEYRVSITPAGVHTLVEAGHKVLVAQGAGIGSGIKDENYLRMGAQICPYNEDIYDLAEMIVKVKEPTDAEISMMKEGQVLFCFLHLAASPNLTRNLIEKGVTAIAYETVVINNDEHPLLKPMSEIAGKMAVQIAARCLEKEHGGKGIILGGVTGVGSGKVVILGSGIVAYNAARVAMGMGARVFILGNDLQRLSHLDEVFGGKITTVFADASTIEEHVLTADALIGAVLITGKKAPKLVSEKLVMGMSQGSVIVDVSVDQGGCVETTRPTTHGNPTYIKHGVVHYAVPNMPGAVPRTSTFALANATIPYVLSLANQGFVNAIKSDKSLLSGVNIYKGWITHKGVAESLSMPYKDILALL